MAVSLARKILFPFLSILYLAAHPPAVLSGPARQEGGFTDPCRKYGSSVVHINSTPRGYEAVSSPVSAKGMGSGLILDSEGHVITNFHVISDVNTIEVVIHDGTTWPARLLGADPETDLAVLEILAPSGVREKLTPLVLGDGGDLKPGKELTAISNPFGVGCAISQGRIHASPRSVSTPDGRIIDNVIEIDIPVAPGDSGGPLVDTQGRAVGLITLLFAPPDRTYGRGFAFSTDVIQDVATQIISTGRVKRPWFGASFMAITPSLASILNLPVQGGAMITKVHPGSPAEQAGLRGACRELKLGNRILPVGGDILVAMDESPVDSDAAVIRILRTKSPGDVVKVTCYRENAIKKMAVKLGDKPRNQ